MKAAAGLGGALTTVLFLLLREEKQCGYEAQVRLDRWIAAGEPGSQVDPTSEARQCGSPGYAVAAVIHGRSRWVTAMG